VLPPETLNVMCSGVSNEEWQERWCPALTPELARSHKSETQSHSRRTVGRRKCSVSTSGSEARSCLLRAILSACGTNTTLRVMNPDAWVMNPETDEERPTKRELFATRPPARPATRPASGHTGQDSANFPRRGLLRTRHQTDLRRRLGIPVKSNVRRQQCALRPPELNCRRRFSMAHPEVGGARGAHEQFVAGTKHGLAWFEKASRRW